MPGRHSSAVRKEPPWSRILVIALAVVAVLAAGALGVREMIDARADSCDADTVEVAVDPALAEVISDLALTYEQSVRQSSGDCVEVTVAAVPSADVAGTIDSADGPHLWIPDSTMWLTRIADSAEVQNLGQVASSPVVVVARRAAAAELGWPDGEFSWRTLAAGGKTLLLDPAATSEGLAGVLAVQTSLGDVDELQRVGAMARLSRTTLASATAAFEELTGENSPEGLTVASEQAVIAHNQAADGPGVVAIYPDEGTFTLDYPVISIANDASGPESAGLAAGFADFLGGEEAAERVHAAGFRDPAGVPASAAGVTDGTQPGMPDLLAEPAPEAVGQVLQGWAAISQEMRMLTVIDVSGSMNQSVPSGGTRIEVTRDAALDAIQLLPAQSEVGLWIFSILRDPPDYHHLELAPVGPLNEETSDGTRFDELTASLESLPDRVEGGTALYDTTLAAFRHMQETYAPGKVNSVVLMTDGRDEDNPASIGLEPLLDTLRDEFDPEAPVPVITIGFGPDADMAALQEISEATGTTAYQAQNAEDIEEVFLRAMIERQCRPDC